MPSEAERKISTQRHWSWMFHRLAAINKRQSSGSSQACSNPLRSLQGSLSSQEEPGSPSTGKSGCSRGQLSPWGGRGLDKRICIVSHRLPFPFCPCCHLKVLASYPIFISCCPNSLETPSTVLLPSHRDAALLSLISYTQPFI